MMNTGAKFSKIQNMFPTQSAELIGSNDDLLTEILHRLPAKSILRFKSVSKQWLSLLSDLRFTLLYDKLSISPGLFCGDLYVPFDVENPTPPPVRSLDFYPDIRGIKILQSCNGLLLCCTNKEKMISSGRYYVFNPTTKKFAVIPPVIGAPAALATIGFMGLAFHPTECVNYKLVCFLLTNVNNTNQMGVYDIQLYSSATGKWKKLYQTFSVDYHTPFSYGVYWNGAIHWAPSCDNPMYFRLDEEHMQEFPLPSPLTARVASSGGYYNYLSVEMPLYFGESRGHLHLVETHDERHLPFNVFEMLRDHSGWFIKYQVNLGEIYAAYPNMIRGYFYGDFNILDVVRGEDERDTFVVVKVPFTLITRYNIVDKSFKQLSHLGTHSIYKHLETHRYIETIGSFLRE